MLRLFYLNFEVFAWSITIFWLVILFSLLFYLVFKVFKKIPSKTSKIIGLSLGFPAFIQFFFVRNVTDYLFVIFFILASLILFSHWNKEFKDQIGGFFLSFSVSILFILILAFTWWAPLMIGRNIKSYIITRVHIFNAHITDLCINRENKSECPKDKDQLRSFNPKTYDQIELFTETKYEFDEKLEQATWSVLYKGEYVIVSGHNNILFNTFKLTTAQEKGFW